MAVAVAAGGSGDIVKDAAQVEATALRLMERNRRGELGEWFAPRLDETEEAHVIAEEGWVLGVSS